MFLDFLRNGYRTPKPSGAAIGAVVGLVGITPAAGYVHPGWAVLIGMASAAGSFYTIVLSQRIKWLSDELDVFTCHGVGGAIGTIMTGLLAEVCVCVCVCVCVRVCVRVCVSVCVVASVVPLPSSTLTIPSSLSCYPGQARFGGVDGAFYGNARQLGLQLAALVATSAYSLVATTVILWLIKKTLGIRVSSLKEKLGLDETLHHQVRLCVCASVRRCVCA
jgi:ammonium transporter, Amt family